MPRIDVAIIGTGPAGLQAALNVKIRGKSFILFGSKDLSRKVEVAQMIDNYLGLPHVTGKQMQEAFAQHLKQMEIEITPEHVSTIYNMGGYYAIATNRDNYEATTVIVATGVFSGKLFAGEERLLGRGVGYCATCDAPLYKGKTVAILGWGEEAVYEANFVSEIVQTLYYIPMTKHTAKLNDNIIVIADKVLEICGEKRVTSLALAGQELAVDGVFVLRASTPPASLIPGIKMQEDGYILVDSNMQTNLAGCFAAGDLTGKPHQYIRSAGQGITAAYSAVAYIDSHK